MAIAPSGVVASGRAGLRPPVFTQWQGLARVCYGWAEAAGVGGDLGHGKVSAQHARDPDTMLSCRGWPKWS